MIDRSPGAIPSWTKIGCATCSCPSCTSATHLPDLRRFHVPLIGADTRRRDTPEVHVLNDAHLLGGALLTHGCPWGIAVIAGTGSVVIALGQDANGDVQQIGRRGGTGYLLGDDGSGQSGATLIRGRRAVG